MSEFHSQDKDKKPNTKPNNNTSTTSVLGSDMMLRHQNHHHHPFSFDHDDSSAVSDSYGPTNYNMSFGGESNSSALDATTIDNGCVPLTLQPFHNISATTALKPSVTAVGMAASIGNPFTYSQWKELERQAMIYKYLVASLPVPAQLLSSLDAGFNKKSSSRNRSNNNDPEEGRCRRTDGKKWRCSREVAPNNKYCERHMHRGRPRPRSRKHVELHTNDNSHNQIKKAHCDSNPFSASDVTVAMPNQIIRTYGGSSSHFHASTAFQPYPQTFLCLENNSFVIKTASFDFSNKQPRGLEWIQNGDPIYLGGSNSGWHSQMHNNTESQCLNSFQLYNSSELSQQEKPFSLFFNPLTVPMQTLQYEKPTSFSFTDDWSNAETVENNANINNNVSATSISSVSLSSLDLPMGGPLGEVLRPSSVTSISDATNSNPCSPVGINHVESIGTSGTGMFSSPSGVLHVSDSSGNSSPTIASSKGQF